MHSHYVRLAILESEVISTRNDVRLRIARLIDTLTSEQMVGCGLAGAFIGFMTFALAGANPILGLVGGGVIGPVALELAVTLITRRRRVDDLAKNLADAARFVEQVQQDLNALPPTEEGSEQRALLQGSLDRELAWFNRSSESLKEARSLSSLFTYSTFYHPVQAYKAARHKHNLAKRELKAATNG